MALTSGTKLGPYEIQSPLGAGGMGEVYLANDTRLGREVAIKVLPAHLSSNPDLKIRFEREARAISSLNHPHICQLYDVGSQDGIDFLVMEYLQGESLDRRLQSGPLVLKQALEYGMQITDALYKAHKQGIIHRDLKPGNIVLTTAGAKLLDFGLAKPNVMVAGLAGSASGKESLTPSTPTMSLSALSTPVAPLTQQGTVVGTFQYMAPEALRGQEADARSDIFSLGCVLYEMLTGRRAFEGKSQLSVLTAILEKDPEPVSATRPATPPALDYVVQACLEKNPEDRIQTAHDVKLQLGWIARSGSQAGAPALAAGGKPKWAVWPLLVAGMAIALLALGIGWWRATPTQLNIRATLLPPEGTHFALLNRNGPPALSPDGSRLAFIASREGKNSLWMRSLDKLEARELPETEGAFFPFWSPDGRFIGFFANGKMWRMDANGGSRLPLADAPNGRGASWGGSNVIVFTPSAFYNRGSDSGIFRVSAEGGAVTELTKPAAGLAASDRWPYFLPDGQHFIYMHSPTGAGDDRNEIRYASLDGTTNKLLLKGHYYNAAYSAGWLLVGRYGLLIAQRFDPGEGKLSGSAIQISDKLQLDDLVGSSAFAVSQSGLLLYQQGDNAGGEMHVWVDETGKQLAQVSEVGVYGTTRIAPDGGKIATTRSETSGAIDIWIWDLSRGTRARFTASGMNGFVDTPVWSSDGRTLYFAAAPENSPAQIYRRAIDGSTSEQRLVSAPAGLCVSDISNDGKWLLYEEELPGSRYAALKSFPLAGEGKSFQVVERVDASTNARLMPGGNAWLAYESSESGRAEIYLTRFPQAGVKYQVSQTGGTEAVWSKDGKRLYYLDAGQRMTAVEIETSGDSVKLGPPKTLFQTNVRASLVQGGYDVAHNGRFLLVNAVMETSAPLTLVTNWNADLK